MKKLLLLAAVLAASVPTQVQALSNYEMCIKNRDQLDRMFPGEGTKTYKCEELKTYLPPAQRYKAAERQGLVQKCERTIRSGLKDPGSYRFKKRQYIATADNGLDIRISYTATNSFGGRVQEMQTCSYTF